MATVARPKLSRKELKQPDEFISFLDQAIEYVSNNLARVILAAVGLVAILVVIFGVRFYWQHQQRLAAEQGSVTDQNLAGVSRDKWAEILEKMSPDDFKYKM